MDDPDARISRGTVLALVAMSFGVFLIANDFTALSVALPSIEREFDAQVSTVQWVINGYALVFGVLIVAGGRLADMFGRRRAFFIGAGIFTAFSAVGAAAPSLDVLLAARALMGVGGALMWPAALGMTFAALPDSKAGLAGGLILGVAGIGNAFGPLLGGVLTEALSWRWVFVVNVPVALIAVVVTWREIQPAARNCGDRIDGWGIVTLAVALFALLLALDEVTDLGWSDPRILAALTIFVLGIGAFVALERRAGGDALVPADVISTGSFRAACAALLLTAGTFFAALLYLPQIFQKLLGATALEAGLALLPLMGSFALVSFAAGSLYTRLGAKRIVSAGVACVFVGIALLSLLREGTGYGATVPGMLVLGVGFGLFISTATTAAVTSLAASRASLGGAILYMFQVAGGSVGLALTTTVFARVSQDQVATDAARLRLGATTSEIRDVQGILAGTDSAAAAARALPADAGQITELVRHAFMRALDAAFRLDAVLALIAVVVTVGWVGGRLRLGPRRSDRSAAAAELAGGRVAQPGGELADVPVVRTAAASEDR